MDGDEATIVNVTLRRLSVSEATEYSVEGMLSTNPFISSESSGDGLPISSTSPYPDPDNTDNITKTQETTTNESTDNFFDPEDTIDIHADPVIGSAPSSCSGDGRLILFLTSTFFHLCLLFVLNPHSSNVNLF